MCKRNSLHKNEASMGCVRETPQIKNEASTGYVTETLQVEYIFFIRGVSHTHPVLALFLSGVFLLHIPCWHYFSVGSFTYTSRVGFIFIWGVSLTHSMLTLILSGDFLLHIPFWLHFLSGEFLLHILRWLCF